MDVADLLRRLLGRRWALLAVVAVALVAGGISYGTAGSSLQGGAAVVIVPPPLGSAVSDRNPLLNLDNNLAQLAPVLAAAMQSSAAGDDLAAKHATAPFTITTTTGNDPSFAQLSPQLVFTVTGSSATAVRRTSSALVTEARTQLRRLQDAAGVPSSSRASLLAVVPPTPPEGAGGGRLRSGGSIGLAILVLGVLGVLLWDELVARRRLWRDRGKPANPTWRRRRREDDPPSDDTPPVLRSR